jgi:GH25 family lysozyme M1 (1,4-beta-N-acetylmuramidase)
MVDGIDVFTLYQDVRDWRAVRRGGYAFCYVKVSDGNEDRADNGYGPAGRAAGLAMGAYHYAQPGNPVAQADRLIARARAAALTDLAPALDLEDPFTPGPAAASFAVAFLRRVAQLGHRPALYGNNTMLSAVLGPVRAAVPETLIWAARYGAEPTVPYDVWQWSSSGHVPGISAGSVDLNRADAIPYDRPAPGTASSTSTTSITEEDCTMIRIPKGGSEGGIDKAVNYQLAVSMLREHDVIIAPGDKPVVLYASYHWAWDRGTGGNPVPDRNKPVVVPVQGSYSYIVPKGTGKVDLLFWADDDFTVHTAPR